MRANAASCGHPCRFCEDLQNYSLFNLQVSNGGDASAAAQSAATAIGTAVAQVRNRSGTSLPNILSDVLSEGAAWVTSTSLNLFVYSVGGLVELKLGASGSISKTALKSRTLQADVLSLGMQAYASATGSVDVEGQKPVHQGHVTMTMIPMLSARQLTTSTPWMYMYILHTSPRYMADLVGYKQLEDWVCG